VTAAAEPGTRRARSTAARLAAVQALYQVDLGSVSVDDALRSVSNDGEGAGAHLDEQPRLDADPLLLFEIVRGVTERRVQIDEMIQGALDPKWKVDRFELVLRAILRAGVYELLGRPHVPARVIINEYLNVAHGFYEQVETNLVNGVLDRLAKLLRAAEFEPTSPPAA
jgi:N utilization substance protein B